MSHWHHIPSTQFFTDIQQGNYFQKYNFEILNHTSLNFARPGSKDSHTASMTAERRKLFEQLPRINTDFNNDNKKVTTLPTTQSPEIFINDKSIDVTQNGAHVNFVNDVAADPDHEDKRKKNRNVKAYRRASAPAQGIDYYFKNAKKTNPLSLLCQNNIPPAHAEVDESVDDDNEDTEVDHHHHHDHNNNHRNHRNHTNSTSSTNSSLISPCDPPSLSPCSSTSSLSSTVSPVTTTTTDKPYTSHWPLKSKAKCISAENHFKNESHSFPDNMGSLDTVPWSPAVSFLASFASSGMIKSLPDEEGQQVGDYIVGKVIGRGGFSTVKLAHTIAPFSNSMETVAVKIVRNHPSSDDNDRVQAMLEREIAIWRGLHHPNVVNMISAEETDYATFVFSEYCPGGTLLDYVKKHAKNRRGLDEDEAKNIFLEIAEAIRYLHNDVRLVHKDIKLDNILLDKDDNWKICDFGLTEFQNSANGFDDLIFRDSVGGSLAYCAPEQLRSPIPLKNPSVDVWSLAVVLYAMVTGQLPFCDDFAPRLQLKIINGRYDESLLDDVGASDELRDLLKKMFKTKPEQRLTISQVLEHQWCERE